MANVYVRSGAAGAGTGADWANAYTTLSAALTAKAAGDRFFVSEDHAESTAGAVTLASPGTAAAPCEILCVNHAGSVPPVSADLATTATIATTGNNNMNPGGFVSICYGITFTVGAAAAGTANHNLGSSGTGTSTDWRYVACALRLGSTGVSSIIQTGTTTANIVQRTIFENTTVQFGATSQSFVMRGGILVWKNTANAITGATLPTTLFTVNANAISHQRSMLEGVDLSALGSGKTIVGALTICSAVQLKDCKLGASVTKAATPTATGATADFIRTDSAGTNYLTERFAYEGTQTVETTIVRTGGASDGTTSIAWKLVTTANSKWALPFEALPIAIWNDSTSSVTVTVYGIWGGGAVPNNDEIWMDVEYLGAAGSPQGSFATSTKADTLASGSALTSDTSTWGGSTTKFKMTATFTPAQKGAIYIYLKAATASTTFYIDPKPVLS